MLKQYYIFSFLIIILIIVEYAKECNGSYITPSSRYKRQVGCRKRQFACDNGQCIPIKNYCDGKSDCTDDSDEELNCNTHGCLENEFQCAYGACIEASAKCDGKKDCRDNSDEDAHVCINQRIFNHDGECWPPIVENGNYTVLENNEYISGESIPNFSIVNINCVNNNYILTKPYSIIYCVNGIFKPELPKCVLTCATTFSYSINVECEFNKKKEDCTKHNVRAGTIAHMKCKANFIDKNPEITKSRCLSNGFWDTQPKQCISPNKCPPRPSSAINVYCELDGVTQDCNKEVPDGTFARMTCIPDYIDINDGPAEAICSNGTWTRPLKKCIPDCNRIVLEGEPFIVNGSSTNRGDFPWHVAVYRQKPQEHMKYLCGGSIISVKVVLSAAHCFTDQNNGNIYPVDEFYVAAGKKYSKWNATEDEYYVQKRNVTKIHTLRNIYFGQLSNFAGDIAVVIVDKLFTFTNFIHAVCIDWNLEHTHQQLMDGVKGKTPGWGATTTGNSIQSEDLKHLTTPFVKKEQCLTKVSYNFKAYVTYDKFCAGYINAASSVCNGDSGSGMVFPFYNKDRIKKYYLQGITSVGQTNDGYCDNNQLAVYTTVSSHIAFVREIEESNRISVDCVAPKIPNGKFTVSGFDYTPGSLIKKSFEITIECNSGFELSVNNLPKCIGGQWSIEIPKCEQETVTPVLPEPPTGGECPAPVILNGRYEVLGNPNFIPGDIIPNFAIVKFTCKSKRYTLTTTNNLAYCINGLFQREIPQCILRSNICTGDSGSGLIFLDHNKNQIDKYYLNGIIRSGLGKTGASFFKQIEKSNRIILDCAAPKTVSNSFVKESSVITLECNSSYELSANNLPKCIAEQWSIEITKCEPETVTPVLPEEPSGGACSAPIIPNGRYEILGHSNYIPGDPIPNYAIVNFTCNSERYSLTTSYNLQYCKNGVFERELPKCVPSCPPLNSTSIDIKCVFNGIEINCETKVPEGTIATMECKKHYVENIRGHSTSICMGGSWDVPLIKCIPECGAVTPNEQPLIAGGSMVKKGDFPWHVTIYRQPPNRPNKYVCGGAIISVKVVLSAAHCFTNIDYRDINSLSEYSVAAGKSNSNWNALEDTYFVQKRKIILIEIPNDYANYISIFAGDIAVIVVDKPFILTNLIKPVCVDWNAEYADRQLRNGELGKATGWGITEKQMPSTELVQITVPYIERAECLKIVAQEFRPFVTLDKYCAGYTNGSSVCNGDTGGGMVFPQVNLRGEKYYIQGIASHGPTKEASCDDHQVGVYTKVYTHIAFIKTIVENNNNR